MIVLGEFIVVSLSVLIILVAPAYAQKQTQTQTQEWSTYEDPILGILIQHPKGWEIEQVTDKVNFKFGEGPEYYDIIFSVITSPTYHNDSEEFMKSVINSGRGDISTINKIENNATVAGFPASKIEFTHIDDPDESVELNNVTSYFMVDKENQMGYIITGKTVEDKYSGYLPTIEKMVNSFKIQ